MEIESYVCQIPCNSLPIVSEADFGLTLKPIIHCDRIAEYNVLIYVLKGYMEIVEDGVTYQLVPGTLFFLKSGIHHWGVKPFHINTAWYYIHFYSNNPLDEMLPYRIKQEYLEHVIYQPEDFNYYISLPKILTLSLGNQLENKIEQLISQYQSSDQIDRFRMNLTLWEILLSCHELGQGKLENAKEDDRTKEMILFIEENYNNNFTANELEEAVGLTYKYAGTLFKKKTGMTIKEYQLSLRLRKAVKLLCETEDSIADIATETGFYDSFYFSKVFKREKGISPLKFRNTYIPKI